ncbi:MAG: hypothetical protein M1839_007966 [Geoglossum umbratile]|nr:MAG: hypothetical protein M1839_007966 [Geoglossum umbratile]
MSSSQNLLALVRREIGRDTDSFPDADLKTFIDFIQSDTEGQRALEALLNPEKLYDPLIPTNCCDTSGFKESTPAFVSLTSFWKFYYFCLIAEEICKAYKAKLKQISPFYQHARTPDDKVKGTLYYNDVDDLEGISAVIVKEWVLEPHYVPQQLRPPPKVEYPLCASFFREINGKRERVACFVSDIAASHSEKGVSATFIGDGEWSDIKKGKFPVS